MAQERFLRWRLEEDPGLVDLTEVHPAPPPIPRPSLREVVPCVARGFDQAGVEKWLVCSVGVDLDLAPFVADVQRMGSGEVIVVTPRRDQVPIAVELLDLLHQPVQVRAVD